jgi:hypothetical protein
VRRGKSRPAVAFSTCLWRQALAAAQLLADWAALAAAMQAAACSAR